MSIPVPLAELTAAMQRYPTAYLLTVNDDSRVHAVSVGPVAEAVHLRIGQLGRRTLANIHQRSSVTLLWPPTDPTDYSLIVDGTAALVDDVLTVTPSRAVLHRAAPPVEVDATAEGASCVSDCIEVPLTDASA